MEKSTSTCALTICYQASWHVFSQDLFFLLQPLITRLIWWPCFYTCPAEKYLNFPRDNDQSFPDLDSLINMSFLNYWIFLLFSFKLFVSLVFQLLKSVWKEEWCTSGIRTLEGEATSELREQLQCEMILFLFCWVFFSTCRNNSLCSLWYIQKWDHFFDSGHIVCQSQLCTRKSAQFSLGKRLNSCQEFFKMLKIPNVQRVSEPWNVKS